MCNSTNVSVEFITTTSIVTTSTQPAEDTYRAECEKAMNEIVARYNGTNASELRNNYINSAMAGFLVGLIIMILLVILQHLHDAKKIDWSRACLDASVIQAKKGAKKPGPTQ